MDQFWGRMDTLLDAVGILDGVLLDILGSYICTGQRDIPSHAILLSIAKIISRIQPNK